MTGYQTSIGASEPDKITVLGQDLATELMGKVSFGELAFWLVALRRPTPVRSAIPSMPRAIKSIPETRCSP